MNKKYKIIGLMVAVLTIVTVYWKVDRAEANPSYFVIASTSSASSSPVFMTPGTATSTLIMDSLVNGYGIDSAVLLVQLKASSTNTQLGIAFEYSQDGIDYYQDTLSAITFTATTSPVTVSLNNTNALSLTGASSTIGAVLPSTTTPPTIQTRAFTVNTPTRFTRAIFTLGPTTAATGSPNGAVWAQFIGKKENR